VAFRPRTASSIGPRSIVAVGNITLSRKQTALGAALLLLLYVFQAVSATTQESNTFDEAEHLSTGYFYWVDSGQKLNPGVGMLAQGWAALPLLSDHLSFAPDKGVAPPNMGQWEQGYRFFYLNGNNPAKMLLQARFMASLLGAALGLLVFLWSRELFGPVAGLISLFLFAFCPTMLAHGALVTADMAAALGFFASTFFFWRLSHTVSVRSLSLSLLALGCLALSKMSAMLIAPIILLILLVRIL
jgi:Dolichyl-phosphate-mannose-protein mannosyltransferase